MSKYRIFNYLTILFGIIIVQMILIIHIAHQSESRSDHTRLKDNDKVSYAEKLVDPIAIFTLFLVVSTVLLWRSTERLAALASQQASDTTEALRVAVSNAEAARRSADAAAASVEIQRVAMIVANRAWLRPDITIAGNLIINEARIRIYYTIDVKNSGTSPAIGTQYHYIELVAKIARSFDDPRADVEAIYENLRNVKLDKGVMIQAGHIDQSGRIYQRDIPRARLEHLRMDEGLFVRLYLIGSIPYTFTSDRNACHQSCFIYEVKNIEKDGLPFFDCDADANYPRENLALSDSPFMDSWTAD